MQPEDSKKPEDSNFNKDFQEMKPPADTSQEESLSQPDDYSLSEKTSSGPAAETPPSSGMIAPQPEFGQYAAAAPIKEPTNPGLIILQWLTYAFWGWTVLALSFLTTSVVANFISDADGGGSASYGIAAVLVLLPLSFILDSFYAKKEPAKKTGAEVWVMVIHAVIFALFGIGALIAAVISVVVLFTSSGGSEGAKISLISALIIAVFYALTFLRTLNPAALRFIQAKYKWAMLLTVGIIALLGLVGPVAKDRATRDDRLIAAEVPNLTSSISDYARTNKKLPADLKTLDLQDDAKQLVDRGLVEYKPEANTPPPSSTRSNGTTARGLSTSTYNFNSSADSSQTFRYQLCVDYKEKQGSNSSYGSSSDSDADDDGYRTYLYVYDHPAGNVCYKMKTTNY